MNIKIYENIQRHKSRCITCEETRECAVCIPLLKEDQIVFEVRADRLEGQPGDICLPGGLIEKGEAPLEAAIREICEELKIKKEQVDFLGNGDILYHGGTVIHIFIVELKEYNFTKNEECYEIFAVPIEEFIRKAPKKYYVRRKAVPDENFPFDRIQNGRAYNWKIQNVPEYFYEWKDKNIWGITARIIKEFIDSIKEDYILVSKDLLTPASLK